MSRFPVQLERRGDWHTLVISGSLITVYTPTTDIARGMVAFQWSVEDLKSWEYSEKALELRTLDGSCKKIYSLNSKKIADCLHRTLVTAFARTKPAHNSHKFKACLKQGSAGSCLMPEIIPLSGIPVQSQGTQTESVSAEIQSTQTKTRPMSEILQCTQTKVTLEHSLNSLPPREPVETIRSSPVGNTPPYQSTLSQQLEKVVSDDPPTTSACAQPELRSVQETSSLRHSPIQPSLSLVPYLPLGFGQTLSSLDTKMLFGSTNTSLCFSGILGLVFACVGSTQDPSIFTTAVAIEQILNLAKKGYHPHHANCQSAKVAQLTYPQMKHPVAKLQDSAIGWHFSKYWVDKDTSERSKLILDFHVCKSLSSKPLSLPPPTISLPPVCVKSLYCVGTPDVRISTSTVFKQSSRAVDSCPSEPHNITGPSIEEYQEASEENIETVATGPSMEKHHQEAAYSEEDIDPVATGPSIEEHQEAADREEDVNPVATGPSIEEHQEASDREEDVDPMAIVSSQMLFLYGDGKVNHCCENEACPDAVFPSSQSEECSPPMECMSGEDIVPDSTVYKTQGHNVHVLLSDDKTELQTAHSVFSTAPVMFSHDDSSSIEIEGDFSSCENLSSFSLSDFTDKDCSSSEASSLTQCKIADSGFSDSLNFSPQSVTVEFNFGQADTRLEAVVDDKMEGRGLLGDTLSLTDILGNCSRRCKMVQMGLNKMSTSFPPPSTDNEATVIHIDNAAAAIRPEIVTMETPGTERQGANVRFNSQRRLEAEKGRVKRVIRFLRAVETSCVGIIQVALLLVFVVLLCVQFVAVLNQLDVVQATPPPVRVM